MARSNPHSLEVVHSLPGRLRLRLSALRDQPNAAVEVADALAALDGVVDVQVRPFTGSILCRYDAALVRKPELIKAARVATPTLAARPPTRSSSEHRRGSTVGRAVVEAFHELDKEVREVTENRLDLGTLAALGFLFTGATEVLTTRTMPAPPWFNLAWWAFRTLTVFETEPDGTANEPGAGPDDLAYNVT